MVLFEGCVADPLQTITAILPGSNWSVLLLRIVMQDAISEVLKVFPQFMQKVHDNIKSSFGKELRSFAGNAEGGEFAQESCSRSEVEVIIDRRRERRKEQ